jgi:hypothetical protein
MLGDVGDPQLVRAGAGELPVDQVFGDLVRFGAARRINNSTAPWPTMMSRASLSSACTRRAP